MLQGRPIDEPVAQYGPFVMNNASQAMASTTSAPNLVRLARPEADPAAVTRHHRRSPPADGRTRRAVHPAERGGLMAGIGWLAVLQLVPWTDVIKNGSGRGAKNCGKACANRLYRPRHHDPQLPSDIQTPLQTRTPRWSKTWPTCTRRCSSRRR
jgi:hypothetical protein